MREPKDLTVLIVDDDEALRKALIFDFKRRGFTVLEAQNGSQAFDIVKSNKVDVVISDVRMPGGDGVELLDKIKALNPRIPVVMFITGFADLSIEEAYDKGADSVFQKPFDRKMLMAAVAKVLSSPEEQWSARKFERTESDFNIDLNFPDLKISTQGDILNIGRGGIFVALNGPFPTIGAKTDFSFQLNHGPIQTIKGSGIVRWIRKQSVENRPAGCGIEFDFLEDENRKAIIDLINNLKTKSFIPKS